MISKETQETKHQMQKQLKKIEKTFNIFINYYGKEDVKQLQNLIA